MIFRFLEREGYACEVIIVIGNYICGSEGARSEAERDARVEHDIE